MDLDEAIRALYVEKKKLELFIASLEGLQSSTKGAPPFRVRRRRGRKTMSPEERVEVSERMKSYWAERRRSGEASASLFTPSRIVRSPIAENPITYSRPGGFVT
jgi:hypothetical protein